MIPDITYFILDYNPDHRLLESGWLKECLLSILYNTDPSLSKTVYTVSQGNSGEHEEYVMRLCRYFNFHFIGMRQNLGVSRGINYCVQMSRSPVVALVTSDVVLTKGMDTDLWRKVTADDNVVHATPMTQKSDIPYQQCLVSEDYGASIVKIPRVADVSCIAFELTVNFWNMDLFNTIGFFDERWIACYENLDFGLRSFMSGGENIISGSSFAWHRHATCYKNGLLKRAYNNYMESGGISTDVDYNVYHNILGRIWEDKWPNLNEVINIYEPIEQNRDETRQLLNHKFGHNLSLPYRQDVIY